MDPITRLAAAESPRNRQEPNSTTIDIELLSNCPEQIAGTANVESIQNATNIAFVEDIPPNGGYGWVCTACVFLLNANTWGPNVAWGIVMDLFTRTNAFPGASNFQYAVIGGFSISMALLVSPIAGPAQKYFGLRTTMIFGALLIFASLLAASSATQIWHLFLSQGLCFGWGLGFIYLPATALLPPWFSTHRGFAVGLSTSGVGLGGLAYSLVTSRFISMLGFTWTYRIFAFFSLFVNVGCALLIKERPSNHPHSPSRIFYPAHFLRIEILLIVCWGFVTDLGYCALFYGMPSYATSIGLSSEQGSVVQAMLNLGLATGRPMIGYLSDRFGRINMALLATFLCAVFCFSMWIPAQSYPVLALFALLAGMMCGTFWAMVSAVLAEVVSISEIGSTISSIMFPLVVPTTFGEGIAMQMVSGTGIHEFLGSQIFVGSMFLAGAMFLGLLRSWKIHQIEKKAANEQQPAITDAARSAAAQTSGVWLTPKTMFLSRRV